jgi:hypothetical protein
MMEPQKSDYPERLFGQPDFELLFKYFPESNWPKKPDYKIYQDYSTKWVPFVGGNFETRQAFWEGLQDPYNTRLIEQRHDVNFYVKRWKLEGYNEDEEGGLNGILIWDPKPKIDARNKIWDLSKEYLADGKDFSPELFAIHWWLIYIVQGKVDPIRGKPFLTKDELKFWKTGPSDPELKIQLEKRTDQSLLKLIKEYETELKFTESKTKAELESLKEKLAIAKEYNLKLKSSLRAENKIRQDLCKLIFDFLEKENVCKSPTGIQMIGAFLIFSSGLSFRNLKRMPNLEFEQEFAKKFRESLNPTKSKG